MKLLAIETATEACSAALWIDNAAQDITKITPRKHTKLILPMIARLLSDADIKLNQLDALAFGCGPGSFTGVRIASSLIQGLGLASDLPIIPVSTLMTLAQGAYRAHNAEKVLVAIDARMQEVYWGGFQLEEGGKEMRMAIPENLHAPGTVDAPKAGTWVGIGSGWDSYGTPLKAKIGNRLKKVYYKAYPEARDMVSRAISQYHKKAWVSIEEAIPTYLRNNVTT